MSTVADPLTEDALEALRTLTGDPGAEFRRRAAGGDP